MGEDQYIVDRGRSRQLLRPPGLLRKTALHTHMHTHTYTHKHTYTHQSLNNREREREREREGEREGGRTSAFFERGRPCMLDAACLCTYGSGLSVSGRKWCVRAQVCQGLSQGLSVPRSQGLSVPRSEGRSVPRSLCVPYLHVCICVLMSHVGPVYASMRVCVCDLRCVPARALISK